MSTTRTAASARDTAHPIRERAFEHALELGKPDGSEQHRSRASVRPPRRQPSVLRLLIGADLLGFATAFLLAQQLVGPLGQSGQALGSKGALLFLAMLPVWSLIASANG